MIDFNITKLVGKTIAVKYKNRCKNCYNGKLEAKQVIDISVNQKMILLAGERGRCTEWIEVTVFNDNYEIVDVTKGQVQSIEDVITDDGDDDDDAVVDEVVLK